MTVTFQLPVADFDHLATGLGGVSAVRFLRTSQLSKHLLLIRPLAQTRPADLHLDAAWSVLSAAHGEAPQAVADLLAEPLVGSWAAGCLRQLRRTSEPPAELRHIGGIAAVAAMKAEVSAELDLPVIGGRVALPTLGAAEVDVVDDADVRVVVRDGSVLIRDRPSGFAVPAEPSKWREGWLGVRRLTSVCDNRRLTVLFDDVDPFRDCYRIPVSGRVPATDLPYWQALLDEAWALLARHLPTRADELAAGLRLLVPLADDEGDPGLSATSRDAFGGLALNRPRDPAALAATLVHEFQHSKLSALLDLFPLYRSTGRLYHAPWRKDPRPVGALMQGAYAFLGVADVWRALSEVRDHDSDGFAESLFAEMYEQVTYALPALAESDIPSRAGWPTSPASSSSCTAAAGRTHRYTVIRSQRRTTSRPGVPC